MIYNLFIINLCQSLILIAAVYGQNNKPDADREGVLPVEIMYFKYEFGLKQNYPNPFNPFTTITCQIPENGFVTLKLFNSLGKEVEVLVNEEKAAGIYNYQF